MVVPPEQIVYEYLNHDKHKRIQILTQILKEEFQNFNQSEATSNQILQGNFDQNFQENFQDVFTISAQNAILVKNFESEKIEERKRLFRFSIYYLVKAKFSKSVFPEAISYDIQKALLSTSPTAVSFLTGKTTVYKHIEKYKHDQQQIKISNNCLTVVNIDNFQWIRKKVKTLGPNNVVDMPVISIAIAFMFKNCSAYDFDYDRTNVVQPEELQCEFITYLESTIKKISWYLMSSYGEEDEMLPPGAGILDGLIDFIGLDLNEIMVDYFAIQDYFQNINMTRLCNDCSKRSKSGSQHCYHCNSSNLHTTSYPYPFSENTTSDRKNLPNRYPYANHINEKKLEAPEAQIISALNVNPNTTQNIKHIYQTIYGNSPGVTCVDGLINLLICNEKSLSKMILVPGYGHVYFCYISLVSKIFKKFIDVMVIFNPKTSKQRNFYDSISDNHILHQELISYTAACHYVLKFFPDKLKENTKQFLQIFLFSVAGPCLLFLLATRLGDSELARHIAHTHFILLASSMNCFNYEVLMLNEITEYINMSHKPNGDRVKEIKDLCFRVGLVFKFIKL